MSSKYHGEQFELRRRNTLSLSDVHTARPETRSTPTFVLYPPNEPEQVYSQPSSLASDVPGADSCPTWPLLSSRSQSPSEPRRSFDDHDTRNGRASEETERYSTSSAEIKDHGWPDGSGYRGQPKPITRNGWLKFFSGWFVHFPALLATIAVVASSQKKVYWYSEEGIRGSGNDPQVKISADTMDNALQLPAKIHELLIVASLSSIALAMFRRRLITDGVRLGFLTGGYRVGDLDYLCSMAFWRQGVDLHRPWEILLAGFVVFATILTVVVGPTSAALLLPTLGWYPLEHEKAFSEVQLPLLYGLNREYLWPKTLTDYQFPFNNITHCKDFRATNHPWCPAGGFSELYSWAHSFRASDLADSIRFQFPPTKLRRELVFTPSEHSVANSTTLCTTPSHFIMTSLGLFWDYIDDKHARLGDISNNTPYRFWANQSTSKEEEDILQPFVQSKCRFADPSEHPSNQPLEKTIERSIRYPAEHLNCYGDKGCLAFQKDARAVNNYTTPWLTDEKWQHQSVTSGFSTIKKQSSVLTLVGQLPEKGNNSVYVCNFLASWVNSTFTVDPKESDILNSTLSEEGAMRDTFNGNGSFSKPEVIQFNKTFIDYLMPSFAPQPAQETKKGRPPTPLDQIVKLFAERCDEESSVTLQATRPHVCFEPTMNTDPIEIEAFLSKIFGAYLTEFIARTAVSYRTFLRLKETDRELEYLELNSQYGRNSGRQKVRFFNDSHSYNPETDKCVAISKHLLDRALPIDFEVERYGYGSGQEGPTVNFALAIMSIYLAVVVVYAAAVGVRHVLEFFHFSRPRRPVRLLSVIPWSDLQDLIVLALKTPPPSNPNLMDSGAGISSDRAWETVVRARTDDELNVQLVLDDRKRTNTLDYTGSTRYF